MEHVYVNYYRQQAGRQTGGNSYEEDFGDLLKLPRIYQRGHGVGAVFGTLWKFLQPLLSAGTNFLKNELVDTGADVLKGIIEQKPVKDVLINRSVNLVDKLRDKAVNKLNTISGSGRKRKAKKSINKTAKRKRVQSKALAVRVKNSKRPRILDIFT